MRWEDVTAENLAMWPPSDEDRGVYLVLRCTRHPSLEPGRMKFKLASFENGRIFDWSGNGLIPNHIEVLR